MLVKCWLNSLDKMVRLFIFNTLFSPINCISNFDTCTCTIPERKMLHLTIEVMSLSYFVLISGVLVVLVTPSKIPTRRTPRARCNQTVCSGGPFWMVEKRRESIDVPFKSKQFSKCLSVKSIYLKLTFNLRNYFRISSW